MEVPSIVCNRSRPTGVGCGTTGSNDSKLSTKRYIMHKVQNDELEHDLRVVIR